MISIQNTTQYLRRSVAAPLFSWRTEGEILLTTDFVVAKYQPSVNHKNRHVGGNFRRKWMSWLYIVWDVYTRFSYELSILLKYYV